MVLLRVQAAYALLVFAVAAAGFLSDPRILLIPFAGVFVLVLVGLCAGYMPVAITMSVRIGRPHRRTAWRTTSALEAGQALACLIGVIDNAWPRSLLELGIFALPAVTFGLLQTTESRAFAFSGFWQVGRPSRSSVALLRDKRTHLLLVAVGLPLLAVIGIAVALAIGRTAGHPSSPRTDLEGLPTAPVTAAYIDARADAHLVYPGATILRTTVNPEGPTECSIDGCSSDPARVDVFLATPGPATLVRDWYRRELATRGYTCFGGAAAMYTYGSDAYAHGRRQVFSVGYVDPRQLRSRVPLVIPPGRTVFETDYVIVTTSDAAKGGQLSGNCYFALPSPQPTSTP